MTSHLPSNSPRRILRFFTAKNESYWLKQREKRALSLFYAAARKIPAYKDFLKKHRVNPLKIKTFEDFQNVPLTNKNNYLHAYPWNYLLWEGNTQTQLTISATSGSTGTPFYFPRSSDLEWESSIVHEMFLRNSSYGYRKSTLVIVCFGMGVWIGGLITYRAFQLASQRGYPVSIITPGINKKEILNALTRLAPQFEQTILAGYPPFIKDILDEASEQGMNLRNLRIRLLFAAEAFTEKFRSYVVEKIGTGNVYLDTLNVYGTADIGTMAHETPTSILMRRIAMREGKLFNAIFSDIPKTPTLAQYNPFFMVFESIDGDILLTGNNAIPLIRYSVGDHGGTLPFSQVVSQFNEFGIDFAKETKAAGIEKHIYQLPLVYVYERSDFSTNLYGLQVYPEFIREPLLDQTLSKFLTGKFTLTTKFDKSQNQYLEIHLEVRKEKKFPLSMKALLLKKVLASLLSKSSEFRELHQYLGEQRVKPRFVFWPAEHELYFRPGTKQKWVLR